MTRNAANATVRIAATEAPMAMPDFAPVLRSSIEDDGAGDDVEACEVAQDMVVDDFERTEVDVAVIGNCEVVKSFRPER
jgi:hypothetical protein